MEINNLKTFLAVSEDGSFSKAADRMGVTQPAISKRVAQLEEQLGTKLFDRIGRSVSLTEAGNALISRSKLIVRHIEDTQRAIQNLTGTIEGSLSLATSHHIGLWRLPEVLKDYISQQPKVNLDLQFMDSAVAHERIIHGELEMAIVTLAPTTHEALVAEPIWQDDLVFVCSRDHVLAKKNNVTINEIAQHEAILPDMTTFTGRIVRTMFSELNLDLKISMSTNYLETIKMLIAVGLGWSVLPKSMISNDVLVLNVQPEAIITRKLGIIRHVKKTLSNAGNAFIEKLRTSSDFQG